MAGEPIPAQTIRQLDCDRIAVRNLYGPSEDTTYSTVYRIKNGDNILIGRPISNTRIYILNNHGGLQPVGVAGEICISGAGLARGYLNQPVLTAEKFVPHPFITGEYLYKTGDLGKWQADGNIVFLGRKDDQVKVRGYRVELGEIMAVLHSYPEVTAAVVTNIKDNNGDNALVAYVVCTTALDAADLRRWLGTRLPHYMLPAYFIQLDSLPLLPNGKLNKKALPAIEGQEPGTAYVAPRNEIEAQLVRMWQQILGREQVGVLHNFFELGGHSLKATRLVSQVQKEFGVSVNIKDVFMNPTIETVGELIRVGIWLERSKNSSSKEDRTLIEI
jgi:acyl-CoA synthetase (AMP-forming)/AMP-acid ligase II/acyl carrier protein